MVNVHPDRLAITLHYDSRPLPPERSPEILGMVTAAHNEFEARIATITSARGTRREMVQHGIDRRSNPFTVADLRRA